MSVPRERAVAFGRWRADGVRAIPHAGNCPTGITGAGTDPDTGLPTALQHDLAACAIEALA